MAAMIRDQDIVKQLQRRLRNWSLDGLCPIHASRNSWNQPCCEYDEQGRLIELHLCELELRHVPSDIWQCSSLESLYLSRNKLSTLPVEVSNWSEPK